MNSLTGAGAGADPFSDYHTDQSTSGSLQQVQSLPVSVVAGATCATASITSSTTFTNTVTSIGKGKSRKSKGSPPKRAIASKTITSVVKKIAPASFVIAPAAIVSVTPAPVTSAPVVTCHRPVSLASFDTLDYCGFKVLASDLLALFAMENDFLRAVEKNASVTFRAYILKHFSVHGILKESEISLCRHELFANALGYAVTFFNSAYLKKISFKVESSLLLSKGERRTFRSEEVTEFVKKFSDKTITKANECLSYVWSYETSSDSLNSISSGETATITSFPGSLANANFTYVPPSVKCVSLLGFTVLPDVDRTFKRIISEITLSAKRTYSDMVSNELSVNMTKLTVIERYIWCLTYKPLYETNVVASCILGYYARCRPDFIGYLSSVQVLFDPSRRILAPLTGRGLRDFLVRVDDAVRGAILSTFRLEWSRSTGSVFTAVDAEVESSSTPTICGRDFISTQKNAGVPLLAISAYSGIIEKRGSLSQTVGVGFASSSRSSQSIPQLGSETSHPSSMFTVCGDSGSAYMPSAEVVQRPTVATFIAEASSGIASADFVSVTRAADVVSVIGTSGSVDYSPLSGLEALGSGIVLPTRSNVSGYVAPDVSEDVVASTSYVSSGGSGDESPFVSSQLVALVGDVYSSSPEQSVLIGEVATSDTRGIAASEPVTAGCEIDLHLILRELGIVPEDLPSSDVSYEGTAFADLFPVSRSSDGGGDSSTLTALLSSPLSEVAESDSSLEDHEISETVVVTSVLGSLERVNSPSLSLSLSETLALVAAASEEYESSWRGVTSVPGSLGGLDSLPPVLSPVPLSEPGVVVDISSSSVPFTEPTALVREVGSPIASAVSLSEDLVGGLSSSSSEQPIMAAISTSSTISTAVEERPTVSGSSF
ncbi:hypothetical protein, partial [Candidatus Ichthyocystis sparus]|uniref:hypothetical protein n=1 Tax=Candidatus Ichthyocystis sparus TaxID=1561004 RepID=UPI001146D633